MACRAIPFTVLLLGIATPCVAQVAESIVIADRKLACDYVRATAMLNAGHFLRAVRREDFEDEIFAAQVKIRGRVHKAVLMYEITETGYEVRSPDEAVLHSSVDGAGHWYVAIDPSSQRIYGLDGFPDAPKEFNRLATDAGIQLRSEEAAKAWISFYLRVAANISAGVYLLKPSDLPGQVEYIAEAYRSSRSKTLSATRWLRDLEKSGVRAVFGIQIRHEDSGEFHAQVDAVTVSTTWMPTLQRLEFSLTPQGVMNPQPTAALFPRLKTPPR